MWSRVELCGALWEMCSQRPASRMNARLVEHVAGDGVRCCVGDRKGTSLWWIWRSSCATSGGGGITGATRPHHLRKLRDAGLPLHPPPTPPPTTPPTTLRPPPCSPPPSHHASRIAPRAPTILPLLRVAPRRGSTTTTTSTSTSTSTTTSKTWRCWPRRPCCRTRRGRRDASGTPRARA